MTVQGGENESGRPIIRLGRYLVIAELGRGGMAEVYLAVARGPSGFSKLVVLKLLRAQYAEEEQFLEMFLDDARLAARLNHPNVIQTYEVAYEGGRQCIVMEYLDGRTLSEAWHGDVAMPLPLAVRVLSDALSGLHHAHELTDIDGKPCGLVHRDISPQNIIVTYDGQVKVLDFGIAKASDSAGMTRTGTFKGKVRYAATERIVGGAEIDRRSDLFSMGVLLWEAATRQRLWSGMGDLAVMHRLASGEPFPLPSSVDPTVPDAIDAICARALSPSPDARYATALDMQDALEDYLASASSVPITSRAVAKFMIDTFASGRERFQRLVDEQLRLVAQAPVEELPTSMSRIRSGEPRLGVESSSVSWVPAGAMSIAFPPSSPAPPSQPSSMLPLPDSNARRRRLAAATLLFVGCTAVGAWLLGRGSAPVNAPPMSPATQSVAIVVPPLPTTPLVDSSPTADSAAPLPVPTITMAAPYPHRGVVPAPRGPPRTAAPTASPMPEPKREVDCSSPYYVDDRGLKKIRAECL